MIRRRSTAVLLVMTLGLGFITTPRGSRLVHADGSPPPPPPPPGSVQITNISVAVSGTSASYYICVASTDANGTPIPPVGAGVAISGPGALPPANFVYINATCPSNTTNNPLYAMKATFSGLTPGAAYSFNAATAALGSNGGYATFSLSRGTPLYSNNQGITVTSDGHGGPNCQVDFIAGISESNSNCRYGGYAGDITRIGPPPVPTATNTPVPTATNTPVPTATNTPVPTATNTPPPSATQGSAGGGGTPPTASTGGGGTPPTASTGGGVTPPTASTGGGVTPLAGTDVVMVTTTPGPADAQANTASQGNIIVTNAIVTNATNATNPQAADNGGAHAPAQTASTPIALTASSGATKSTGEKSARRGGPSGGRLTKQPGAPSASASMLRISAQTLLVRPGGTQQITLSYVASALVQVQITYPGLRPVSLYNVTDSHGHLSLTLTVPKNLTLHNGHATATIAARGVSGSLHNVATLAPSARPGTTRSVAIRSWPNTMIRAVVTFPGGWTRILYDATDSRGHLVLPIAVPKNLGLGNGLAPITVAVAAMIASRQARAQTSFSISDMVVSVTASSIRNCAQTHAVHVLYKPHAPLRIVLLLPQGRRLPFVTHADGRGTATVQAQLTYVRVDSPVHIGVQVTDMTPRTHRSESVSYGLAVPPACQKPSSVIITVGS